MPWDVCSPPSSPPSVAPLRARACGSSQKRAAGPAEGNERAEKMWKVPALLLVCASALLWAPAGGASTVPPEDDVTTPSTESGMVTRGVDDNMMTSATSEHSHQPAGFTSQVPTNAKHTDTPIEDLPTSESTSHTHEEAQSTTALNEATSHPRGDTHTTGAKDGFATGTLIGIIVGVLLGIGFIAGIIIVVVRKMSGRYSP